MGNKKKVDNRFHYNNAVKQNKNFMYSDLKRSNCYGSDFTGSNFNCTSFRGAHFKGCNFFGCSFKEAEFIGTNFKKSKFKKAKFENAIFEGVNLSGVDFKDAEFKNVIFFATDLSEVKNMIFDEDEVIIFEENPELMINHELRSAFELALKNEKIKASRVLDTKEGAINAISVMVLQDDFNDKSLISGLKIAAQKIDKDFCTLSYLKKQIKLYEKQGLL